MNKTRSVFTTVGFTVLAISAAFQLGCEKKAKLDSDMGKVSYAIGQQIGNNMKSQQIEIDAETLAASIKDATTGKESKMKPEEMQAALQKLQEGIMKKQTADAEKNKAAADAFMAKNKTEPNVKSTASGLQYVIEKEGTGKSPKATDTVTAHYKGTLTDGKVFDSSYDRGQPAEFPLANVIKGWTEGLQLMKVGGKAKFFIPPELGYGPAARQGIPANSALVFEVELIAVK